MVQRERGDGSALGPECAPFWRRSGAMRTMGAMGEHQMWATFDGEGTAAPDIRERPAPRLRAGAFRRIGAHEAAKKVLAVHAGQHC